MRRQAGRFLVALTLLASAGCGPRPETSVLLVSLDTLRADAVAGMPVLSRLAAEGVSFPRVYAASNWTLPSHASLFLSQPCSEHGVNASAKPPEPHAVLPASATVLAEAFRAFKYRTFSTAEGGYLDPAFGFARGFDGYHLVPALSHKPETEIDRHTDELVRFVEESGAAPVFAFVHTYRVHDYFLNDRRFQAGLLPEDAPWRDRGTLLGIQNATDGSAPPSGLLHRLYRGAALDADRFLGRLIERLREADRRRRWLIVVTADHGESLDAPPPHRGHGNDLNEDQLRVPWIVTATDPETRAALPRSPSALASGIDIAPSILGFLKAPIPPTFRGRADLLLPQPAAAAPPFEASYLGGSIGGGKSLQLALLQGAHAVRANWYLPAPPAFNCYRRAGERTGSADWNLSPGECGELETAARDRLRIWARTNREARATPDAPVVSDALRAELKSLGYL